MSFRFRKSITLLPGLRLNLGKKSGSLSLGIPGATLNFGKNGIFTNLGLPGTGLSYRTKIGGETPADDNAPLQGEGRAAPAKILRFMLLLLVCLAVFGAIYAFSGVK
jgi:hypothetical protein